MPIDIKEMHVRTTVEQHVVTDEKLPEEVLRSMEDRIAERLSARESEQPGSTTADEKKNKR